MCGVLKRDVDGANIRGLKMGCISRRIYLLRKDHLRRDNLIHGEFTSLSRPIDNVTGHYPCVGYNEKYVEEIGA